MANYFGYMRISTAEKRDLQSFTRQDDGIRNYADDNGVEMTLVLKDDTSGSTFDRPEWKRLERLAQPGDTIIFKELSRFTREADAGMEKYMELYKKGINLIFIDNPTVSTDYIARLTQVAKDNDRVVKTALEGMINLLLMVELDRVEQEREIIRKRIKQGMAASDKKPGRKDGKVLKFDDGIRKDIEKYLTDRSVTQKDIADKHGISRTTVIKYIKMVQKG